MFGFAMVLVEVGPTALRVIYLAVRGHPFGVSTWVGTALLPIELAGTVFVDETVFVLVHLSLGTLFVARALLTHADIGIRWLPWHEQRRRRTSSTRSPNRSAGRSCSCCGRASGR